MTEISALRLRGVKKGFIEVSGRKVFYAEMGEGQPVVMVHGWMGSSVDYPTLFPFLAKNFRVLIPDLPGFGESERMEESGITNYSYFIKEFAKVLGLKRFFLVGNCFGASIALDFVLRFPEMPKKAVLFTPIYSKGVLRMRWVIPFRLFNLPLARRLFRRAFQSEKVMRAAYSMIFRHSRGAYKEDAIFKKRRADFNTASKAALDLLRLDLSEGCKNIRVPVLIVVFENDRVLVPGALTRLKRLIPKVEFLHVDKGHFVDPDLMIEEYEKILKFFRKP